MSQPAGYTPHVGGRSPTGANSVASESTAIGAVQSRPSERSFGLAALDVVGDIAGDDAPQLTPRAREHAAALIDAGMEQALSAARGVATAHASDSRRVVRMLGAAVVALAFAVVGVFIWSLGARLDKVETHAATSEKQISESERKAIEHRKRLDANVKTLAGHAVSLTTTVNKNGAASYELLEVLVKKLDAEDDVPKAHKRPALIEAPVVLRYIAGER